MLFFKIYKFSNITYVQSSNWLIKTTPRVGEEEDRTKKYLQTLHSAFKVWSVDFDHPWPPCGTRHTWGSWPCSALSDGKVAGFGIRRTIVDVFPRAWRPPCLLGPKKWKRFHKLRTFSSTNIGKIVNKILLHYIPEALLAAVFFPE